MKVSTKTFLSDDFGNNISEGCEIVLTLEGKGTFECKVKNIKPRSFEVVNIKGGLSVKYTEVIEIYLKGIKTSK